VFVYIINDLITKSYNIIYKGLTFNKQNPKANAIIFFIIHVAWGVLKLFLIV